MRKFFIISLVWTLFQSFSCFAQQEEPEVIAPPKPSIFETLTDNADKSKGTVILTQDDRIKDLVLRKKEKDIKNKSFATTPGFRVQVFSSNEQKTAKTQAYKIEEKIKEKFPEMAVYVSYFSPFWKVRVGDCLSNVEAQDLRDDLKKEFPEYQQETYIVKDQVLVPE
jgi:hypothetical protein